MTICLAIKYKFMGEGKESPSILFAADTQETSNDIKRQITKLQIMRARGRWVPEKLGTKGWQIAAAFAGDVLVADEALDRIHYFLYKKLPPEEKHPAIMLEDYRGEIGGVVYDTFRIHNLRAKEMDEASPYFELMLGMADEHSTLLYVNCDGKTRLVEEFGAIGSGAGSGGELLLREFFLKGKSEKSELSEEAVAGMAALVISVVGQVDMFVSGKPTLYYCRNRRVLIDLKEDYLKILKESELRWGLIRKTWQKMQVDKTFESKLRSLLGK